MVGAIVPVVVMDEVLEHTTVTGAVLVVVITCDIMKNTLKRKINSQYNKITYE